MELKLHVLLEVGHATVADIDFVEVEDFVEHLIFWELFITDLKKHSFNIGSHVLAKRLVVPKKLMMFLWHSLLVQFTDCVLWM